MNLFTFGLFNSQGFQSAEVNRDSLQQQKASGCLSPTRNEVEMADTLISPIEHPSEAFECLDCFLVDTLNEHGRCARCGSNAVMPYMVLEKSGYRIQIAGAPSLVFTEQTHVKAAESTARFSEQPRHCRTTARSNTPKPVRAPVMRKRYA
jgi:hypothetical protein